MKNINQTNILEWDHFEQQKDYNARIEKIGSLLVKIQNGLEAHEVEAATKPGNWGYNGDLGHVYSELKELSDWLNNEGEYD